MTTKNLTQRSLFEQPVSKYRRRFSPAEEQGILAAYVELQSTYAVARRFSCSAGAVTKVLARNGRESRPTGLHPGQREITDEVRREVMAQYLGDVKLREIAAASRVSVPTVKNIIRAAGDYRRGNRLTYRIDHSFFQDIDTEQKAYLLGFIAADGNVSEGRRLQITLQSRDKAFLESLRDAMNCDVIVREYSRYAKHLQKTHQCASLAVYSPRLVGDLRRHGIHNNKTFTVRFWDGPAHLMRHYVRGLLDGDGTIYKTSKTKVRQSAVGFAGNRNMMDAVADYFSRQIGVDPTTREVRPSGRTYQVKYTTNASAKAVCSHLYDDATLFLPRKKVRADAAINYQTQFPDGYKDWSDLTAEQLLSLRRELPSWYAVARSLGMAENSIGQVRRRLGIH